MEKGFTKGAGVKFIHGGKGEIYVKGPWRYYQTQLKTDLNQGLWGKNISLGVKEWEACFETVDIIQIVNSLWYVTHRFKIAEGQRYGRVAETKIEINGTKKRFLMPIAKCFV